MSNEEMKEFLRKRLQPTQNELPTPERRKQLRKAFKMSQRELAEHLGVSDAAISAWEVGRNNPTGEMRAKYLAFCRNAEEVLAEQERNADASPEE